MGDGPGIDDEEEDLFFGPSVTVNSQPGVLTVDMLEKAAQAAAANFGTPTQMYFPPNLLRPLMSMSGWTTSTWSPNPQYAGTPWADRDRLTKREHAVAKLHTALKKLGALKGVDEQAFEEIKNKSVKRLKRAKWAQKKYNTLHGEKR